MSLTTLQELIELAITAEKNNQYFYEGLVRKFAHIPSAAAFWAIYVEEEQSHAAWLMNLLQTLPRERCFQPAAPTAVEAAKKAAAVDPELILKRVRNLADAFETASELEFSETNTVFEFLISSFATDRKVHAFLRSQLHEHSARLMSTHLEVENSHERAAILALE